MAMVNTKTLILKEASGTDLLTDPQLSELLATGWQLASSEPLADRSGRLVTLVKSTNLHSVSNPAQDEDRIVWQGRPPFPGTPKEMRKNNPGSRGGAATSRS